MCQLKSIYLRSDKKWFNSIQSNFIFLLHEKLDHMEIFQFSQRTNNFPLSTAYNRFEFHAKPILSIVYMSKAQQKI